MSGKDAMEKTLEAYNDVFSDILNVLLFDGERIVGEEDLRDETHRSVYKADGKIHEQERDVAKYWRDCSVRIALYGIENQTSPDADMPLRVIGYDGASYRSQLLKDKIRKRRTCRKRRRKSGRKRYPVVTLVLYFGKARWKKPLSLKECLKVPEKLHPYVNDYRINLFEIAWLEDRQVNLFQSDFRAVADFFVQMRKNGEYQPSEMELQHVDEVLKLLSVMSGDSRFEEAINEPKESRGISMRKALDKTLNREKELGRKEGRMEGRETGLLEAICSLMETMKCSAEQAMALLKIPLTDREKYLSRI